MAVGLYAAAVLSVTLTCSWPAAARWPDRYADDNETNMTSDVMQLLVDRMARPDIMLDC